MKFFRIINNSWAESEYDPLLNHIIIYDFVNGVLTPIGIGQY